MLTKQILCISWDDNIAESRKRLLESQGYEVHSALGYSEAVELCEKVGPDLLILGHSVPSERKLEFVAIFRRNSTSPVLSLLRPGQPMLPEVEYGADCLNPGELVKMVHSILRD